jgi:glucose uptake protein GlcU
MAFAPSNVTIAYLILLSCIIFWGSYAPLRRTSNNVDGASFGSLAFIAELLWSCFISMTFGSMGVKGGSSSILDSETNFFTRLASDVATNPGQSCLVLLGGALVGFGDSMSFVVLKYVPSSLAFPTVVGTCTLVGTTISYFVDGSEKPVLLFSGVILLIPSVILLAYAQSKSEAAGVTTPAQSMSATNTSKTIIVELVKQTSEIPNSAADSTDEETETNPIRSAKKKSATWKWIALLVAIGCINSLWGPLSTVGRRNCSIHSGYFLLSMGRIGIQPISQSLTQLIIFHRSPINLLYQIYNVPRRDKCCAFGCGLLIGLGYYAYFIGSNVVNKSAAFAISNCSPLWTIVIGVCVQHDLKRYRSEAKIAVIFSTICFVVAVTLLSFSGA